jgi:hypothetical protein
MLPIPFLNTLPVVAREGDDPARDALVAKADDHLREWGDETIGLLDLMRPDRCRASTLDSLADFLNAAVDETDSDAIKRQKIFSAIKWHKRQGSWSGDVKPKLDTITGGDAFIVSEIESPYWVLNVGILEPAFFWSAFGFKSENGFDGIILDAGGGGVDEPGVIYIDLSVQTLTGGQLDSIRETLRDSVPAYYRVFIRWEAGEEEIG